MRFPGDARDTRGDRNEQQAPAVDWVIKNLALELQRLAESYNSSTKGMGDQLWVTAEGNKAEIARIPYEVLEMPPIQYGIWRVPEAKVGKLGPVVFLLNQLVTHYVPDSFLIKDVGGGTDARSQYAGHTTITIGPVTLAQPRYYSDDSGRPMMLSLNVRRCTFILTEDWQLHARFFISYRPTEDEPKTVAFSLPSTEKQVLGALPMIAEKAGKYVIEHRNNNTFIHGDRVPAVHRQTTKQIFGELCDRLQ